MKKTIIGLLLFCAVLVQGQSTAGSVELSITSLPNGKQYSPRHVLAIWVEDASGAFVKTIKLRGSKRKQYLYSWNSSGSGNTTDASTGATLSAHQTHNVIWDCTNTSGSVVADGEYKIKVEYTSEHAQGPLSTIAFTKSANQFTFQPTDESYYTNIDILYTPASTTGIETGNFSNQLSAYPVPAKTNLFVDFVLEQAKTVQLRIYSIDMKLVSEVWNGALLPGKHSFSYNVNSGKTSPGTYFVVLSGDNMLTARQFVVSAE